MEANQSFSLPRFESYSSSALIAFFFKVILSLVNVVQLVYLAWDSSEMLKGFSSLFHSSVEQIFVFSSSSVQLDKDS